MNNGVTYAFFISNKFVQHPRRKCNFGGSLTYDEVIDFSIGDVIVDETRFHPALVEEENERSVVSVKKHTKESDG